MIERGKKIKRYRDNSLRKKASIIVFCEKLKCSSPVMAITAIIGLILYVGKLAIDATSFPTIMR